MRNENSSDILSSVTERKYDHQSYFGDQYTMKEVKAIFDANGIDAHIKMQRLGLLRYSQNYIDAQIWMEKYFYRFEHQPNSKEIHLDPTFKRQIWLEYIADMKKMSDKTLSEGNFRFLWTQLFDLVKMRRVKRITGKCWTCSHINDIRQKQKAKRYKMLAII